MSLNYLQALFVEQVDGEDADQLLIKFATDEMSMKLEEKRLNGKNGWWQPDYDEDVLFDMLNENLKKGDMVDVMNLAAMIHARRELWSVEKPKDKQEQFNNSVSEMLNRVFQPEKVYSLICTNCGATTRNLPFATAQFLAATATCKECRKNTFNVEEQG